LYYKELDKTGQAPCHFQQLLPLFAKTIYIQHRGTFQVCKGENYCFEGNLNNLTDKRTAQKS
jgi:hypothetical protein